ncbi:MAG: elongation factor G [Thermoguttaceae bacterium]|jgi:elongation factor G|nr:elongation factor G [Thermoguttaceae bacterium]
MSKYQVAQIRNIVLCGHGSAGKTTLVDTLLHKTGAVKRHASVDDGTSICDFDEEEKHHKYTIESTVTHFDHAGQHFHAIDTPGYPDFIGQAIGAMRGADTAVIVINAQAGIEVNTRRVFAEAEKAGLGRIIVLNKMDSDNIDFPALVDTVREVFGNTCQLLNVPLGHGGDFKGVASTLSVPDDTGGALIDPTEISESLLESIIEVDEEVMERYFEGQQPSQEELSRLIVRAVAEGTLIPILCCSGKTGAGLPELLDGLSMCALPPGAVRRVAKDAEGNEVEVKADPAGPLVAQVFKTRIDPFVQKISFLRVFSGTLREGETVAIVGHRKGVKLSQLNHVQAEQLESIPEVGPGGICAVTKVEELETGATLGELVMPRIPFPVPMVGLAVSPKSRGDETKLSGSLNKIVQEDPAFRLDRDAQTKEIVATGMSELHLQIIQERLKRRDKVEVDTKEPKIPYRETIQANAEGMYRHKKQTGGRGQFGEVHIRMFPFPKDTDPEEHCTKARFASMREYHYDEKNNFVWIDSIVGGTIPSNFLPAVEKGFKERMTRGVIAGYQVQNVAVEVHFGKYHPVDSSEAAFKMAGSMAFRNVFQQAKPALLEPIVKIEITIPSANVGDINSDLSGRRGRVLGMDSAGAGMQTITAEVPLAEVMTYARSLSSITGGQGSYAIEFSHYDVVPGNVQQEIIAKAKLEEEEDE